MTANQIAFFNLLATGARDQETARANRAREAQNEAQIAETRRTNLANEVIKQGTLAEQAKTRHENVRLTERDQAIRQQEADTHSYSAQVTEDANLRKYAIDSILAALRERELNELARSNRAKEQLTARGQDITAQTAAERLAFDTGVETGEIGLKLWDTQMGAASKGSKALMDLVSTLIKIFK